MAEDMMTPPKLLTMNSANSIEFFKKEFEDLPIDFLKWFAVRNALRTQYRLGGDGSDLKISVNESKIDIFDINNVINSAILVIFNVKKIYNLDIVSQHAIFAEKQGADAAASVAKIATIIEDAEVINYSVIAASHFANPYAAAVLRDLNYLKAQHAKNNTTLEWSPLFLEGEVPENFHDYQKNYLEGLDKLGLTFWKKQYLNWMQGKFDIPSMEHAFNMPQEIYDAGVEARVAYLDKYQAKTPPPIEDYAKPAPIDLGLVDHKITVLPHKTDVEGDENSFDKFQKVLANESNDLLQIYYATCNHKDLHECIKTLAAILNLPPDQFKEQDFNFAYKINEFNDVLAPYRTNDPELEALTTKAMSKLERFSTALALELSKCKDWNEFKKSIDNEVELTKDEQEQAIIAAEQFNNAVANNKDLFNENVAENLNFFTKTWRKVKWGTKTAYYAVIRAVEKTVTFIFQNLLRGAIDASKELLYAYGKEFVISVVSILTGLVAKGFEIPFLAQFLKWFF